MTLSRFAVVLGVIIIHGAPAKDDCFNTVRCDVLTNG